MAIRLEHCRLDLKYALRVLAQRPAFTLTAVLSVALGIGANTAIFSLVDQVLLRALPVRDPQQIVLVDWRGNQLADGFGTGNLLSYPMCRDLGSQTQFFDGVFCRHPATVNVSTGGGVQPVLAEIVSGSYFPVLGVRPHVGRLITESDDLEQDGHPVVVLAFDYWITALGRAPDIVGRTIRVNNYPMTVIGVAERGFAGMDVGEAAALWVPAMMKRQATRDWDRLFDRRTRWMHVFGRLKSGVTAEEATAGLRPWFTTVLQSERQLENFPRTTPEQLRAFLGSYLEVNSASNGRSDMRRSLAAPLWILLAGTALLVLLGCSNTASLLLARGSARGRELVTRIALGASHGRIVTQLLIESLVISLAGGMLALAAAPAISAALLTFLPQDIAHPSLTSNPDRRVLAFTFVISVTTGALCGLAPSLQARRVSLVAALRERAPIVGGVHLRRALVVGQIAFTLILVIGAGLFVQTVSRLYEKGTGFESDRLLMFQIDTAKAGYQDAAGARALLQLLESIRNTPGIGSAAIAGHPFLTGRSWNTHMTIDVNGPRPTDRVVHCSPVSPRFFSTLGARLIAGRDFAERGSSEPSDRRYRSAIVNASFARRYFGDGSPLGHHIGFGMRPDTKTDVEIIGVVADFSYRGIREDTEQAFFPFLDLPWSGGTFYVRTNGNPQDAFAAVRDTVASVDPTLPALSLRTVDDQIARSLSTERMTAAIFTGFGAIALLLSVIGLYGVMSYIVTQRTREIGVRVALGATPVASVLLVMRGASIMIACGTAIALPAVWALGRVIAGQLFGVAPFHVPTIASATALLAVVALAATIVPAWHAASVRPTEALRTE